VFQLSANVLNYNFGTTLGYVKRNDITVVMSNVFPDKIESNKYIILDAFSCHERVCYAHLLGSAV